MGESHGRLVQYRQTGWRWLVVVGTGWHWLALVGAGW